MKTPLLITGSSGLVGSRFLEIYQSEFEFESLDLKNDVDITDKSRVNQVISSSSAQTLIHLAAFTDVSRAWEEKGDKNGLVYKVNVLGTKNIVEACKANNKYLIHISTDFVFDGQKTQLYTEEDPVNPIEWYGQTKAEAEQLVKSSGVNYAIFRLAFPFRAEHEFKKDLIRNIIDKINSDNLPPQFDDILITPTFIDDICTAFYLGLEKQPQGIYHCVGSDHVSAYKLVLMVAEVFGLDKAQVKKGSFKDYLKIDSRPRQQYLALDNAKIQKELGFKFHSLSEALETVKSQREV